MVPFDTLKLARDLRDRGKLTAEQAEGIAASLVDAFQDNVATKSDLQELRTDLIARVGAMDARPNKRIDALDLRPSNRIDALDARLSGRIDALDARFSGRIDALGKDLTIRLGGMLVVAVGAMAALVKLL
jgi:hypothetical protein